MPETYMRDHGPGLFEAGFEIIPIVPHKKNPSVDNWRSLPITEELVDMWARKRPGHGVGIKGSSCPALDIDVDHPEAGPEMQAFVEDLIGRGPLRRGGGHKVLLPVNSDIARKMKSTIYTDGERQHAVELLTDGQQWVAYGFHEGAGRDYLWERGDLITASLLGDIPELTAEQLSQIFVKWDEIALRYGFKLHRRVKEADAPSADAGAAILEGIKSAVGLSMDELSEVIMEFPCDTYDDWFRGGMALYHETGGSDEGLDLFDAWSTTGVGYPGFDEIKKKWASFSDVGPNGDTVTIRTYLHELHEKQKKERENVLNAFKGTIDGCDDAGRLLNEIPEEISRNPLLSRTERNILAAQLKKKYQYLSGTILEKSDAKRLVAMKDPTSNELYAKHKWAKDWVWLADRDKFFHLRSKSCLSKVSFNAKYNRLFREDDKPDASAFVLDQLGIPIAETIQYHPGEDQLFFKRVGGKKARLANSYDPYSAPEEIPFEEWKPKDRRNVEIVENHINDLFAKPFEARVVMDWIAWIVQNPGRIMRWAVVLVGVQGDGKTFIAEMMRQILGQSNVNFVNHQIVESGYSSWSADTQLVVFDEVRISGKNRVAVMDMLKSYIGNGTLAINEKYVKERVVQNMASYFLTSNHHDALALTTGDRRYWPVKTKWDSREEMLESGTRTVGYFNDLFAAIEESPGAIRQFFLEWTISDDFSPNNLPQATALATKMIDSCKGDLQIAFDEMVEDEVSPYVTKNAVSSTAFFNMLTSEFDDYKIKNISKNSMSKFFSGKMGFTKIDHRVRMDGKKHTLWVRDRKSLPEDPKKAALFLADFFQAKREEFEKRLRIQEMTDSLM